MAITPSDIAANADVCQKIFAICDIEVVHDEGASWITIDGSTDFSVIARDGTGGLFLVTPLSPRIVYASSEGEAGVIADDLEALMTLIVTCPWWQDLLKYSGKGDSADEMRRAAPFLESSWIGEEEEFAVAREFLTSGLGIASRAISSAHFTARSQRRSTFASTVSRPRRCSAASRSMTIHFTGAGGNVPISGATRTPALMWRYPELCRQTGCHGIG